MPDRKQQKGLRLPPDVTLDDDTIPIPEEEAEETLRTAPGVTIETKRRKPKPFQLPGYRPFAFSPGIMYDVYKSAETFDDPALERKKINQSVIFGHLLNEKPSYMYDNYDLFMSELKRHADKEVEELGPLGAFWHGMIQGAAEHGSAILQGATAFTPGEMWGLDKKLEQTADWIESFRDPERKAQVQKALEGPLWPKDEEGNWDLKMMPDVINTWAAQVGDQVTIMAITLAAQEASKGMAKLLSLAGGPAAPIIYSIISPIMKHVGGAAPLIGMEAGGFLEQADAIGISPDIAEKYARIYGVGAGVIEYSQVIFQLAPFKKIGKKIQGKIIARILMEIGVDIGEGLEELSQGALERFFMNKAIEESDPSKLTRPPEELKQKLMTGGLREFAIGAGVAAITRGFGNVTRGIYNKFDSKQRIQAERVGIVPEGAELQLAEIPEAPEAEEAKKPERPKATKEITAKKQLENIPVSEEEAFEGAAELILREPNAPITKFLYGEEKLIGKNKDFYEFTTPKGELKGAKHKFAVQKWQKPDGVIRYTVHSLDKEGKITPSVVESAVQFRIENGIPQIMTIATAMGAERIGLASKLIDEILKDYGDFAIKEPISKQGYSLFAKYFDKMKKQLVAEKEAKKGPKQPWEMTREELKNWDFKTPVGGASKSPKTVFSWDREDIETLADIAKYDEWRLDEALGAHITSKIPKTLKLKPAIKKGKPIKIYRAAQREQGIIPGAYVSESKPYVQEHGEAILGEKEDWIIHEDTVYPDELMTYGDPHEFLYIPRNIEEYHKKIIQKALSEKKPVPREILEEYEGEEWATKALNELTAGKKKTPETEEQAIDKLSREYLKEYRSRKVQEILEEEITEKRKVRKGLREGEKLGKETTREREARKRAKKKAKAQIRKMASDLKKVLKKSEFMPAAQRDPIRDLLKGFDLAFRQPKTLEKLRKTKEWAEMAGFLQNDPDAELPQRVLDRLQRLEKKNLNDMTMEELSDLFDAVMHYQHLHKTKKRIKIGREKRRSEDVLKETFEAMRPPKEIKEEIISSTKGPFSEIKDIEKLIVDTLGIRHDHYDLLIEKTFGINSTPYKVLFSEIKKGILKMYEYERNAQKKFQEDVAQVLKQKGLKIDNLWKWANEKVKVGKVELTRQERMALYRHFQNEDNRKAIIEGGFGFRRGKDPNRVYKLSEKEFSDILKSFTPEEKAIAEVPVRHLFDKQGDEIAKVFYERNNYELPREEVYYPKDTMPYGRRTDLDLETQTALEKFRGQTLRIGLERGMLEKRKRVQLPIYLNGLFYDLAVSTKKASAYIGLEMPLAHASKLLYNREFKTEFISRYGKITFDEIEKALRDIALDWKSYTTVEKLAMNFKSKLATAVLGLDPFIMLKQILSYPLFQTYVKPRYLIQGMIDYGIHPSKIIDRHRSYSVEFDKRITGGFSRDVADMFKKGYQKQFAQGRKSIQEIVMSPIRFTDKNTVSTGMQGAILQALDEFDKGSLSREVKRALDMKNEDIKNLSAEEKMKKAYEFADWITERTQPMFSKEHMSSLQRGTPFERLMTMFGSYTNQALNLIRRNYNDLQTTKDPAAFKKLAWTLFAIGIINTGGIVAIDELKDLVFGRDEDEEWWEKVIYGVIKTWGGYVFFVRDVIGSTVSKVQRGLYGGYEVDIPIARLANNLVNSLVYGIDSLTERFEDKRREKALKAVEKFLETMLMSLGIPYYTPKKLGERAIEEID